MTKIDYDTAQDAADRALSALEEFETNAKTLGQYDWSFPLNDVLQHCDDIRYLLASIGVGVTFYDDEPDDEIDAAAEAD